MSVRINPCFGCPLRVGCEQRAEFSKKVAGLGLRSATFNCARLSTAIAPGTRIVIASPVRSIGDYDSYDITRVETPATITSSRGNEFACVVDREPLLEAMREHGDEETDVDRVRFRKTMRHSRIVRFLDEPRRGFCEHGSLRTPDGKCEVRDNECSCQQFKVAAA
jgi:hypothetical protein